MYYSGPGRGPGDLFQESLISSRTNSHAILPILEHFRGNVFASTGMNEKSLLQRTSKGLFDP